ncbi:hypothetical protein ATZ99_07140 [Thermovenabulum gondwanense]|uniref:Uncharacterized protein n=1 Tax=Thermovenabulum gondwanense TaxID=520767 RepID=A0A162MPQ1_9FIRM|nr:hypothetical protein ATZ99_07140 [Thermovenabulum gondwanense]
MRGFFVYNISDIGDKMASFKRQWNLSLKNRRINWDFRDYLINLLCKNKPAYAGYFSYSLKNSSGVIALLVSFKNLSFIVTI